MSEFLACPLVVCLLSISGQTAGLFSPISWPVHHSLLLFYVSHHARMLEHFSNMCFILHERSFVVCPTFVRKPLFSCWYYWSYHTLSYFMIGCIFILVDLLHEFIISCSRVCVCVCVCFQNLVLLFHEGEPIWLRFYKSWSYHGEK